MLESIGGKILSFYFTMGEYDKVVIAECPNDEVAMTMLLFLGEAGNVRTTTLKGFSREELAKFVGNLPK